MWAMLLQHAARLQLKSKAAAHLAAATSCSSPYATGQDCMLTACAPAEEAVATALSSTQLLVSLGARQVLANSAAACAAEMGSMRSTLHVLAAHLEALQGTPVQLPAAGELQVLGSLLLICVTCGCKRVLGLYCFTKALQNCVLPSPEFPATRELSPVHTPQQRAAACEAAAASLWD